MVTFLLRLFAGLSLLFLSVQSMAQLTISSPVSRMVFQRNQANEALVLIAGVAPVATTSVEARFVPITAGQGNATAWSPLAFVPGSMAFRGQVTVTAGWYRLDVRAKAASTILAQTSVGRVGVGEVFLVAGQSNAFGRVQRVASSVEDRVSCLDFQQDSLSDQLLPLQFSRPTYGSAIGPSQPPHLWSTLGDKLVQRLNVPVLFLGAALGGSSSTEWQQGAAGNLGTTTNSSVYRRLGEALLHYISRTGARAVLWHQGETDTNNGTSQQTYYNNINYVIQKSRQQVGNTPLGWMVSRASFTNNQVSPAVIAAQNQLIANIPNVFAGPYSDTLTGPENRADGIHLSGMGLIRFTNSWDQALSAAFFQNAMPFMPTDTAALLTSGYMLPLTRRQGDMIAVASLRSNAVEADNLYVGQIIRASDGATVYESAPSTDNPILITVPASLPNGQYRLRTRSTHPVFTGTPGEPFTVQQSVSPQPLLPVLRKPVAGGTANPAIRRFSYSYEPDSHGFYALIESTQPVEVRIQRIDGGGFSDSGWNLAPPSSQAPDYDSFASFNYIRNYPPVAFGVGGVEPAGKYRYSIRVQGDTGPGLWFDLLFMGGRTILYQNEPIPPVAPILTVNLAPGTCLSGSVDVAIEVTEGSVNSGNVFSVRLSDASGSFANETVIGTGPNSPVSVTLPSSLPFGTTYRIRVVASSPAVASAPSGPLSICNGADLSLSMALSSRTPQPNQPVTFTLVLTNEGPLSATGVVAQSRLPDYMNFMETLDGDVSVTGKVLTLNASLVTTGNTVPFVVRLKPTQEGFFAVAAQITASSEPDPDSQPNSGTGDGQDDAATVDLRTPNASGPVHESPNPDQVPLPPVQSSQPPTDPATADLSVSLRSDKLVATVNEVVSFTLSAENAGGATASSVTLQSVLPAGWQLMNSTGLTVAGQTVTGSIGTIPAGSSGNLVLQIRIPSAGTMRAQVFGVTPADPDSTPGNGYDNGEDDEVSVSLRLK